MPLRFASPADITASHDGACFGGKALGLAALAAAGVRVPPFFAVEASTALPAAWSDADRAEFLRRAAEFLSRGRLAVRSSALGEDGAEKSFAGLFETILGVANATDAIDAASRCVASGAATRATSYAGASTALPVGVVCQIQVEARSAGVCFTRDPSGRDGAVVIEAIRGLGDALVSGAIDPERWRVYRSGLGGWEAHREGASQDAISADEAIAAAREALDLAARLGRPLDLEWARDATGALWWLQARPITASTPRAELVIERSFPDAEDGPVTVWANWNIRETMPDPLVPLSWAIWRDVFLRLMLRATMDLPARSPLYRPLAGLDRVNGRVYWNMNCLSAIPGFGWLSRKSLWFIDEEAYRLLTPLYDAGVIRPRRLPGPRLALLGAMAAAQAKSLVSVFEALSAKRTTRRLEDFGAAERACLARPAASLSDAALIHEMTHLDGPEGRPLIGIMNVMGIAMGYYTLARIALRRHPDALRLLVSGLTGNPTTQISIGIDALVGAARPIAGRFAEGLSATALIAQLRVDEAGRAWTARLDAFLDRFGQRCPKEFDFASPRWIEDPTMIVELVRAGLRTGAAEGASARLARLARERRAAIDSAVAASPWWMRGALRFLVRKVEEYMPLREAPKHHLMFAFLRMRRAAIELGARLAKRGILTAGEDVFFLELSELSAIAHGAAPPPDLAARIESRRAALARFEREPGPDNVRSDGVPVLDPSPAPVDPNVLRGTPVSGGRATGPARLLRTPDPTLFQDGDILVVAFADPGWTPLFARAGGLVMEVGGTMCHAAVVAREMGVPSVFGVRNATKALREGDVVTVDGERGTVELGGASISN